MLGDYEDLQRRKQLAAASFNKLWKLWKGKISEKKRLQLYETYITPILTYNAWTWALTQAQIQELESFRRKQLRSMIGIHYPSKISNENLYKRCGTGELAPTIRVARWKMVGHTLRMADDIPAKQAMLHYFSEIPKNKSFKGRPRTSLPIVLNQDLKLANEQLNLQASGINLPTQIKNLKDLRKLEDAAKNRKVWKLFAENMQVIKRKPKKPESDDEKQ